MKQKTSFLTRCLALALALVLIVSNSGLGFALQGFAAEHGVTSVTTGELVANSYELTDEEKALLTSGYLAGEVYSYTTPSSSSLIAVDTEESKITAGGHGDWIATTADIVVGGETVETVALTDGTGFYTYDGNAFSVVVTYILTTVVEEKTQTMLLNAGAYLQEDIATADAVAEQGGNLYILEQAMPSLVDFAENGIKTGLGNVNFKDVAVIDAILAMDEEMTANCGVLDLTVDVNTYNAGTKTGYVVNEGATMQADVISLVEKVALISDALDAMLADLNFFISFGVVSADVVESLELLAGVTANLEKGLADAAAASWTASNLGTDLVNADADFAELDTLVAAVKTTSAPAIKNPLTIATTKIQANLSMNNVTVTYTLMVVEDKPDSDKLVEYKSVTGTVTLPTGATAQEIAAAVEAAGIFEDAMEAWSGKYAEKGYYVSQDIVWPEKLEADFEGTVVYSPVMYQVLYVNEETVMPVPYGYQLTLPVHEDPSKSYDYIVNDEEYAQGDVVVCNSHMEIIRTEGKAYFVTDLYTIIADNYGNAVAKEILKSGALNGNETVRVRKPEPSEADELLDLARGVLTAQATYKASYAGLNWVPYTYGANGTENKFEGNTASWSAKEAKVMYILELTNIGSQKVLDIMNLIVELKADADKQIGAMNRLCNYYGQIGELDNAKLGGMNGVVGVTDFTPDDGDKNDAKTQELRAYFNGLIGNIINNNVDTNGKLKLYNMLTEYQKDNGGLRYYYNNAEAIISEVRDLSTNLNGLVGDAEKEAALAILLGALNYGEYVEKIASLGTVMSEVLEDLSMPNEAIDLDSANIGKLITALEATGSAAAVKPVGNAYLLSDTLTALDDSQVTIEVTVVIKGQSTTITLPAVPVGTVVTADHINTLKTQIQAVVDSVLGDNQAYYTCTVEGGSLNELVGTALEVKTSLKYTYNTIPYTVKIEGEADQTVTIEDLEVTLPQHPNYPSYEYQYYLDGAEVNAGPYTFTAEQLATLFNAERVCTFTRKELNPGQIKFENFISGLNADGNNVVPVYDNEGKLVGLEATIDPTQGGIMSFAMNLIMGEDPYTYVGLNNQGFAYLNDSNALEISVQTLIDAIMNDDTFSNQTIIDLGKNNGGKLVKTTMDLGNSADVLYYDDLEFTLNLKSVPSQVSAVAGRLNQVKNYFRFYSNNGQMDVELTLPQDAYEAFVAGMVYLNRIDKTDVNELNTRIAADLIYEYFNDIITNDAITTTTFQNTLEMIDDMVNDLTPYDIPNYDLEAYEKYYQKFRDAFNGGTITVDSPDIDGYDIDVNAKAEGINAVLDGLGLNIPDMYRGMVKELKDGQQIDVTVVGTLTNTLEHLEAAIVDVRGNGVTNKTDLTNNLPARVKEMTGPSAIMLLDDVDGDVNLKGYTVLDLNGKTINGNLTATNRTIIIDSSMETANCGGITGTVSGPVTIVAGNYNQDVSAMLCDGYKQVGTSVQNALYTIEADENGNVTFVINTDAMHDDAINGYLPNVPVLAADIAVDLVTNYYCCYALQAEGCKIYGLDIGDPWGLWASDETAEDFVNMLLNQWDFVGTSDFVNIIIEDLLDFAAIESAINNNEPVATYAMSIEPITIGVEHVTDGDYLSVALTTDPDYAKDFSVSLKFAGSNKSKLANVAGFLADIVVADTTMAEIHIDQPYVDNRTLFLAGSAEAVLDIDLTKNEAWQTALAVVLAYGNEDKADEWVSAIGNTSKLRRLFDKTTVEEIFNALKAMNRNVTLSEMAESLGVTLDTSKVDTYEYVIRVVLSAAGKALEVLDINGYTDKTMGQLRKTCGRYVLSYSPDAHADITRLGLTLDVTAVVEQATLAVNIFGAGLWGDADSDGDVDYVDAMLIAQYDADMVTDEDIDLCVSDVDGNGVVDFVDAMLVAQYDAELITIFPVEE